MSVRQPAIPGRLHLLTTGGHGSPIRREQFIACRNALRPLLAAGSGSDCQPVTSNWTPPRIGRPT